MSNAAQGASATSTDRELAEALARHGDERAFRQLYQRHTPRLYQLVLRFLGGREADAEDVVQETWVRAVRGLGEFRWDAALSTWVCGIGIRVAQDLLRRRARDHHVEWPEDFEPDIPAVPHGERIDLERAIALLPDGSRAVLVLHDVEGMKHVEIGELLGISPGTSKSQLHHARRMLRARLSPAKEANHA